MPKFFTLHDSSDFRVNARKYWKGTWEPTVIEHHRLIPFQVAEYVSSDYWSTSDYLSIIQVVNDVENDITEWVSDYITTYNGNDGKTYKSYSGGTFSSDYITGGRCYFKINDKYSEDCDVMQISLKDATAEIETAVSDDYLKFEISATVDIGDTHYADGFKQIFWKQGTVERGKGANVEIIGDERNGMLVKEKITTSTVYKVRIKVTESEFTAMVEALPGTWTITDTSGKVYNCYNIEIADPDWYQSNGICEITFRDNISIFAYNNNQK